MSIVRTTTKVQRVENGVLTNDVKAKIQREQDLREEDEVLLPYTDGHRRTVEQAIFVSKIEEVVLDPDSPDERYWVTFSGPQRTPRGRRGARGGSRRYYEEDLDDLPLQLRAYVWGPQRMVGYQFDVQIEVL